MDPLSVLNAAIGRWGDFYDRLNFLTFKPVSRDHTLNLLKKLGSSTAQGIDGIDANTLKLAANEIATPLNFIINMSLTTSTFANKWKISKIVPILK